MTIAILAIYVFGTITTFIAVLSLMDRDPRTSDEWWALAVVALFWPSFWTAVLINNLRFWTAALIKKLLR
jgi:cytosine/uracil/thiamine/allantoin permease